MNAGIACVARTARRGCGSVSSNPPTWSRSLIPNDDGEDLTRTDVQEDIFNDDYPLLRKAIAVAGDQYDYPLDVNGKSTKIEMASWFADNMTRDGIATVKRKAQEKLDESD